MSDVDLLDSVLSKTTRIIALAEDSPADAPTPCPGYDVGGLIEHMVSMAAAFANAAELPADGSPLAAREGLSASDSFAESAARAVAAFRHGAADRTLRLQGELPGSAVLGMMLMEYIAHGWDLATATGHPVDFSEAEALTALDAGRAMMKPEYRGPESFEAEVTVPDDAPAVDRLLGFLGREPRA
jgi:uncharacterized protein (TIGR03086 family)